MQAVTLITLYGKGAITVHDGKGVYSAHHGQITVPPTLVARVLAMGFSRHKPPEPEEDSVAKIDAPDVVSLPGSETTKALDAGESVVESDETDEPTSDIDEKAIAAATRALPKEQREAIYRKEIEDRGYSGAAVDSILAERFRFDELVLGGMSEDDAAREVWGGGDGSPDEPTSEPTNEPQEKETPATQVVGDTAQAEASAVRAASEAETEAANSNDPRLATPESAANAANEAK